MPPGSMQYTLVGFSAELDWRPLHFVKPIPPHSVCGACGLVRKRSAFLPCSHTLCESCYEQSARDGVHVCPLDGRHFDVEDVFLKEFTVGDLLRREVKCWNEGSACSAVLPASQIGQHFRRECRHHSIRCPKCTARVLCTDVCAHLESECCTTTATPAGLECQGDSGRKEETALLTSPMQSLEAQAGELKALMERVLVATGANGDRLNEVVHGVNSCQETLREELRLGMSNVKDTLSKEGVQARTEHRDSVKKYRDEIAAVFTCQKTLREELRLGISSVKDILRQEVVQVRSEHRESLKKCSDEITAFREDTKGRFIASCETMNAIANCTHSIEKLLERELTEKARGKRVCGAQVAGGAEGATQQAGESSSAMGRMDKAVSKQPDPQASVCEFVVKGVRSLKEKTRQRGWADYESERVYLRGYCMSPSFRFFHLSSGITQMRAFFRLRQGDMDDVVHWPFQPRFKLRVVHPKRGEEREREEDVFGSRPPLQRPQEGRAQYLYETSLIFYLEDLISGGYVENDQLRLKLELLP
ncbi:uncharacterized protein LOC144105322 isoform X1 [Amblyomma americanum]